MEQSNRIQRSEEWKQIHEIIKQLPIKNKSGCDCMDAPSVATEIEALFLKLLGLQNVRLSLPDIDNYQYLKGFMDACGVNWELADKDDYPEGLNSYDEVINRVYELKGNKT